MAALDGSKAFDKINQYAWFANSLFDDLDMYTY